MTFDIVQTVAFFLLSAAYIVRGYPWKNFDGLTQTRVSLALLGLSAVGFLSIAFLGTLSILVVPEPGSENTVSHYIALGSMLAFLVVVTLSFFAWGRHWKEAAEGKNEV